MSIFQAITDAVQTVDQGDVFVDLYFPASDERVSAVVINPTCDLKQSKADYVKFVSTVSLKFVVVLMLRSVGFDESIFISGEIPSIRKYNHAIEVLKRNINGDLYPRYYLMPGYGRLLPASYLDFQKVFVIPTEQVYATYLDNCIASIASPWREQVVARYSGYSMRVGTVGYTEDDLQRVLIESGLAKLPV